MRVGSVCTRSIVSSRSTVLAFDARDRDVDLVVFEGVLAGESTGVSSGDSVAVVAAAVLAALAVARRPRVVRLGGVVGDSVSAVAGASALDARLERAVLRRGGMPTERRAVKRRGRVVAGSALAHASVTCVTRWHVGSARAGWR